jgi:hypothetical protein
MGRSRVHRFVASAAAFFVVLSGLTAISLAVSEPEPASAANAADFNPGNIISDANFFNGNAMNAGVIQNFLNNQVPSCASGATCLKSYTQTTWTRAADPMCNTYQGAANESSATIIAKVGQACNISQAVLLVLLQKEQSLITSTNPSARQYAAATGFACPDTAPCDAEYSGFYNQVYKAAWQYKRYSNPPGTSAFFTWIPVGKYSNIPYHPNAACGTSPVLVQNRATAGLYYYTPYQPNATAMSNIYGGQNDGCSSYGNRNFWRLYTDWFGNPTVSNAKHGGYDEAFGVLNGLQVTGWAVDPATANPTSIYISVDGKGASYPADKPLNWIEGLYPGLGQNHGYSQFVKATPGRHEVCVSQANGVSLGCKTVTTPSDTRAAAAVDLVEGVPGGVRLKGWSVNKQSSAQTYVWVNVDGSGRAYKVDQRLSWTPNLYPNVGNLHGYDVLAAATPGLHTVCIYGVDSILLGCYKVTVPPNEAGAFSSATGVLGGIKVDGWTLDKRSTAATYVWINVNGSGRAYKANKPSDAAATAFPAAGKNHGFSEVIPAKPGTYQVCAIGTLETTSYGCRSVTVPFNEVGSLDTVEPVLGGVNVSGWSLVQGSSASTYAWITIDGGGGAPIRANKPLAWVNQLFPGIGANHGFSGFIPVPAGKHTICAIGTSEQAPLGCKEVTVPSSGAASLDSVTTSKLKISLSGWAVDRLSKTSTWLWVNVDGVGRPYKVDKPLSWIDNYFPGVGPNHGFAIDIPASAGVHEVCVWHSFDNQSLGCRSVDVPSDGATAIDSVTGVKGGVAIKGWSVDRTSTQTTYIWVKIDGNSGGPVKADKPLGWIDAYFPGVGPNHGIDAVVPAGAGAHQVCITATFDNRNMGCYSVSVPAG